MKTSWLCATLLPLFLFSCAIPEKQCRWKENIPEFRCVPLHRSVNVSCPNFTVMEMKFELHKGEESHASFTYANISYLRSSIISPGSAVEHRISEDNTTRFILHNVSKSATDLYTCSAEKLYPPPVESIPEKPQTIVIVEDHPCLQNSQRLEHSANHLPLLVGFGLLSTYALIITCVAISLRFRLKREDMSAHDYMNMKPRTRRRKQGIHHPTHLSWYNDTTNGTAVSKKLPSK